MTIAALPKGSAQAGPKALVTCDQCHREEVITVDYQARRGVSSPVDWDLNVGQAVRKLQASGWKVTKGAKRTICPTCVALNRAATQVGDVDDFARLLSRITDLEGTPGRAIYEAVRLHPEVVEALRALPAPGSSGSLNKGCQLIANALGRTIVWQGPTEDFHFPPEPKETEMPLDQKTPSPSEQPPRQPTREQRRLICDQLDEVYDIDAGRYRTDWTDAMVADLIGDGIMPGWVTELREKLYGDSGENEAAESTLEEIRTAREELNGLRGELMRLREEASRVETKVVAGMDNLTKLERRVEHMKKALGTKAKAVQ